MTKSDTKEKNKLIDHDAQRDIFYTIAFWGLAVLLFLPPYFRGMFYQPEQERALIFAAVVFWFAWLWKWSKRDNSFLSQPLDYFVLAFPAVYLISAFQAVNYGLAVDEAVKTTLYFMVYWLASRLVRNENDIKTILKVIYISASGVALAGLAIATGIINHNAGFWLALLCDKQGRSQEAKVFLEQAKTLAPHLAGEFETFLKLQPLK